jgi:hypothetical protein
LPIFVFLQNFVNSKFCFFWNLFHSLKSEFIIYLKFKLFRMFFFFKKIIYFNFLCSTVPLRHRRSPLNLLERCVYRLVWLISEFRFTFYFGIPQSFSISSACS